MYLFSILFASLTLQASELKPSSAVPINLAAEMGSIPKDSLVEIQLLFKELFYNNLFAYSLYCDKPMSFSDNYFSDVLFTQIFEGLPLEASCREILDGYSEPYGWLKQRWVIWKKYEHLFDLKKYMFAEKKCCGKPRIFFINKQSFKDVVNKNIDLFQKYLGLEMNGDRLLSQFETTDTDVMDILRNHEALLGILLGFGRLNSIHFERRERLIDALSVPLNNPIPIQKEIENLHRACQPLYQYEPFFILATTRIGFLGDPKDPETILLRKKYDTFQIEMQKKFSCENWFEKLLLDLTLG
jgi:hypothetical protein